VCVSVCVCVCLYVCVVVCVYIRKHHDALVYAYFIVCVLTQTQNVYQVVVAAEASRDPTFIPLRL
jgi:hypothetical protein